MFQITQLQLEAFTKTLGGKKTWHGDTSAARQRCHKHGHLDMSVSALLREADVPKRFSQKKNRKKIKYSNQKAKTGEIKL